MWCRETLEEAGFLVAAWMTVERVLLLQSDSYGRG